MVVRHVGRGHQDRRYAERRQLAERGRARAADDKIGCPHDARHIVDVLAHIERRVLSDLQPVIMHPLLHRLPADLTDAVNVVERLLRALQCKKFCHRAVHRARAEAPPEGNDQRPAVVHAERFLGLLLRLDEEVAAHGRAGHDHFFRVLVVRAALFKTDHDALAMRLQLPRRQPRHDVRLVYRRGNARLRAVAHERIARIAAGTDDEIGTEILQNGVCLTLGVGEIFERDKVVPDLRRPERAVKRRDVHRAEGVIRVRDQVALQSALRADE